MSLFKLGKLSIDAVAYCSQGSAVLGIRDSGKTYTAMFLAERLFEAGIPFIAFDPVGVWRFLRVPGNGRGYPVVVAGGSEGDLPLTVQGAPEIVRSAMRNGVSLVIDLFDINLSKADWRRIVLACVNVLLHENKAHGLRHIFIEEAAEFIPQKPIDGLVYAAVEKLARMGGNSRLGYTLINQRSQEVAKAVLELCENVFLHRQRGKNALENMDKWLSVAGEAEKKEIIKTLPSLPQGECWAWLGGDNPTPPMLVKVPAKNSLHPDRRVMHGDKGIKPAGAIDVSDFVTSMRTTLVKVDAETKANDPKALRAEITRLRHDLATAQVISPPMDPKIIANAERVGYALGFKDAEQQGRHQFDQLKLDISVRISDFADQARTMTAARSFSAVPDLPSSASPPAGAPTPRPVQPARPRATPSPAASGDGSLPKGERLCLSAIAQNRNGVTRQQLTVITGYKRSTRDAYLQRLREKQYTSDDGGRIHPTDTGLDALGTFDLLPTGVALQQHVLATLPEGERAVLACVIGAYPQHVERDAISNATGYKRSTRDAYIQRLSTRELVDAARGSVRASEDLFG